MKFEITKWINWKLVNAWDAENFSKNSFPNKEQHLRL
jgi:hypothetical protein